MRLLQDLSFYDLRLPEALQAQADLAKAYGIHGFCYYHYWFTGKRLLERPFNDVLASGEPDLPFCLCWANENWTPRWDGQDSHVLAEQLYSVENDQRHLQALAPAFQDPRYIRVDNKPLFPVYRANKIPNPKRTAEVWREEAHRLGIGDLYLCRVESFPDEHDDPASIGFDAAVEFQPDWPLLGPPLRQSKPWRLARKLGLADPGYGKHRVHDYATMVERMLAKPQPSYKRFPCVTPSWNNTARRRNDATILDSATPELYERWPSAIVEQVLDNSTENSLIFINA